MTTIAAPRYAAQDATSIDVRPFQVEVPQARTSTTCAGACRNALARQGARRRSIAGRAARDAAGADALLGERARLAQDGSEAQRERQVMALVVRGLLNEQVGGELGISEITVKAHRGRMMRKMGAKSLPELVNMAARLGVPST